MSRQHTKLNIQCNQLKLVKHTITKTLETLSSNELLQVELRDLDVDIQYLIDAERMKRGIAQLDT